MKFDLDYNIEKINRCLISIKYLSNPNIYYNSSYRPQYISDKGNRKLLKQTIKNVNRLIKVINKQSQEKIQTVFPYYKHKIK